MSKENKEIYEFGPYRLDVGEHVFERTDGAANDSLPEKAFQTLVVLVRNRGRLVTKNELIDAVWPDAIVEENNLDKSIHAIRNALQDRPTEQRYIKTIRKHGYRFVADVKKIDHAETDEADPAEFREIQPSSYLSDAVVQTANGNVDGQKSTLPEKRTEESPA